MTNRVLVRAGLVVVASGFIAWAALSALWLPPHMVSTTPYRVDQNPGSRDLIFDNIHIPSHNLMLEGWWIPAKQAVAELIFVHGAGSNRISQYIGSLDFYRTLHELNVSIVTMDIRNHGNSPITDGILRMGSAEWPDVEAAARWLDQHHPSDLPRIALGASMGGSTVIHALVNHLEVDAVILLDPQLDILDSLMEVGQITTGIPAPLFVIAAHATIHQYDLPNGRQSPLSLAKTLNLPILLIQDWDDPATRSPFAAELARDNPNVQLQRVPAIDIDDACLEGKEEWGSHVAAHPCHPEWTKKTLSAFIDSVVR